MVFLSSPLTYTKMNTLFLLKHTSSKRVTFNAISCLLTDKFIPKNTLQVSKIHNFATAKTPPRNCWVNGKICNSVKGFHVGRSLQAATASALEIECDDDIEEGAGLGLGLEISKLGISQEIVSALAQRGITSLFPIQKAVLEPAMQGSDMIGRARTGTGKTLAFGIPIMDKIIHFNKKNGKGRNPLALILAPTRELARQVEKEFYESAPGLDTLCVYGGVPISRQMSILQRGADIVVGTPGRIIDLLKRRSLNLSDIQFVVLDEADQMLNVGFAEDVETILENVRQKHQTMMFSATMPSWILKITKKFLKKPINIDLVGDSDQKLADGISLYSIACEMRQKPAVLGPLISEHAKGGKCIVFTQTKRDADRLASVMQKTLRCEALHGDITQTQRERTLSGFRQGQFNVLVATDVAARGLDVPNVDLVIHYELPNSSEIFVHRSGRTGRAGKKGSAIVIHSLNQHRSVRGIESDVGCRFTELPRINVEAGAVDLYSDMDKSGDRFGSYGGTGRGRSGDFGGGRSGGYGNSGSRFGERGSSSVRRGGFSGSGSGRSGGGSSGPSSGRSSKFGGSGDTRGSKRLGGFRNFSSGSSSRFGDSRTDRDNRSSRFDGYGDGNDSSDQSSGRNFSNPIPRRRAEWEFTFNR